MSGGSSRRAARGLGGFVPPTLEDGAASRESPVTARTPSAEPAVRMTPAASAPSPTEPAARAERVAPASTRAVAPATTSAAEAPVRPAPPRRRPYKRRRVGMEERYDGQIVRTTITLPTAVDDALDEIVFHQRKSGLNKNDLMLQGIEAVLVKYGAGKIASLVKASRSE